MHPQNQRAVGHPTPSVVLHSFHGQMLGQNGQTSRTEHRLEAGPEAQKQKIAPDCNFFAIRDCRDFLNRGLRPKMQQKWLYDGSFPLCRSEGGIPNRKKVAKKLGFLFLRLADRRDGANPAKDESLTRQNQGIHQESNKKPPEGGFRSQIYGWASRIPALCERSPPWRKRLRANP